MNTRLLDDDPSNQEHSPIHRDIIIIGAGPSGLSLGYELIQHGLNPLILEAGRSAGWAWKNMPENISLLSPWKANHLPGTQVEPAERMKMHTCHEFADYLRDYANVHYLDIHYQTPIEGVTQEDGLFVLETPKGRYTSHILVNATGYFFKPYTPDFPGMDESNIRQLHVHHYKSADQIFEMLGKKKAKILVVGKRVSAGQTLTELHDSPHEFNVVLSRRSEVVFAREPWLLQLSFHFYYEYEDWRIKQDPYYDKDSYPPMEAGRTKYLLKTGKVPQRPNIQQFHKDQVEFENGVRESFDLIIYTTGFRPALGHLQPLVHPDPKEGLPPMEEMESVEVPNLFFMGLDMQRSVRSRYLRGIREDAGALGWTLKQRLKQLRRVKK